MPGLEEAPASPEAGLAPAPPHAATAPTLAPELAAAAHHRGLPDARTASAERLAAEPLQSRPMLIPMAPPVLGNTVPGITTGQVARAEEWAAEQVGLALMNPGRRLLKTLHSEWAHPKCWTSHEEMQAKTGCVFQVNCGRFLLGFLRTRWASTCRIYCCIQA